MLFKGDKTCNPNQEKFVNFLIETREKQLLITNLHLKELENQIEILERKKAVLLFERKRFEKIIFWLKECRFSYYLRSGK